MSRKHFQAIASLLKHYHADAALCHAFASFLAVNFKSFDRTKFLLACGIPPTK